MEKATSAAIGVIPTVMALSVVDRMAQRSFPATKPTAKPKPNPRRTRKMYSSPNDSIVFYKLTPTGTNLIRRVSGEATSVIVRNPVFAILLTVYSAGRNNYWPTKSEILKVALQTSRNSRAELAQAFNHTIEMGLITLAEYNPKWNTPKRVKRIARSFTRKRSKQLKRS